MLVRTAMVGAVFRLANSQAARPAHREEYASSVSLRAISEYRKCTASRAPQRSDPPGYRRKGRGCGGSRRPLRTSYPRCHAKIIGELAVLPMLPILQTMFKKEIRAIVAGSDHFIRRLLHEPDIVGVLPDNGGAGWF